MKNNKTATTGEVSFYNQVQGKKITAINGNSSKGTGWRPVCGGKYLGEHVCPTEKEAIIEGKKFMAELKRRVEEVERRKAMETFKASDVRQSDETNGEQKSPDPALTADVINKNNPDAIPLITASKTNRRNRAGRSKKND